MSTRAALSIGASFPAPTAISDWRTSAQVAPKGFELCYSVGVIPTAPIVTFATAAAPPGGNGVGRFRSLIAAMESDLDELLRANDRRAVFQLTYLTFSRQVLAALEDRRFEDHAWAGDMCCRFVQIYLVQLELWAARDPRQCRAWTVAFERMEGENPNVMQAMLLGMNAHINYDLPFCTLGACIEAGDVPWVLASDAFHGARGVPSKRYRDFLLINRIGWESIPIIQDTVLKRFAPLMWLGNIAMRPWTSAWGQRVLLESRDAAWLKTVLLLHCTSADDRACIASFIDDSAERWAELVGALTVSPGQFNQGIAAWRARGARMSPATLEGLLRMVVRRVPTADLVLDQLVAMGVDAVRACGILLVAGAHRSAVYFCAKTLRSPSSPARRPLEEWLLAGGAEADAMAAMLLEHGHGPDPSMSAEVRDSLRVRASRARRLALAYIANASVAANGNLRRALEAEASQMSMLVGDNASDDVPVGALDPITLLSHPDRWIRLCAGAALEPTAKDLDAMAALIERTLFLKESPLFVEVEAADLIALAERLVERVHASGGTIVAQGDLPSGLHVVVEGEVSVEQQRATGSVLIATMHRGDAIGEVSLLTNAPTTANCIARGAVKTWFIPQREFIRLLQEQPRLAVGLLRVLSERLAETTKKLEGGRAELATLGV